MNVISRAKQDARPESNVRNSYRGVMERPDPMIFNSHFLSGFFS